MKKKKEFVSGSILLCVAGALSICAALPVSAGPAQVQERTTKSMFADQDREANEVRKLVAKGDYAAAIKRMQENVIEPLRYEASRVDSWKVRARLAEFEKELRDIKSAYASGKIKQAEAALGKGLYDDAIASATEAMNISELFRDQAMQIVVAARGRKNAETRKMKSAATTSDPEIEKREKEIKRKLAEAHSYFRNGHYDKAWEKVEEIYVINPYNADAAYLASQIYKKFYIAGYHRRNADIQAQLAYEAWQWVEPVFPVRGSLLPKGGDSVLVKSDNDYAVQKKLDEIVFNVVSFNKLELEAVVQFMRNNKHLDPDREGVMITFIQPKKAVKKAAQEEEKAQDSGDSDFGGGDDSEGDSGDDDWGSSDGDSDSESDSGSNKKSEEGIFVTLELNKVTLRQLLDYVCFLTDLTYVVRDNRVIFGAEDTSMSSQEYDVSNTLKVMIAGQVKVVQPAAPAAEAAEADAEAPSEGGDGFGDDPFAEDGGNEPAGDADAGDGDGEEGKKVPAPPKQVTIANDKDLTPDALRNFFSLYGVDFPEKSSISFYRGKIRMNNTAANHRKMAELIKKLNVERPMVEVEVKSIELAESDMEELGFHWSLGASVGNKRSGSEWKLYKGSNTKDNGEGMLKMLDAALSGVDSRLISGLNIFPDLFGSFKPFGIDQTFNLTLTINALDRSDRTEQISAPRVLVADGVQAQVKMTKTYFFPSDWEELEIEMEEVGDSGNYAFDITYPSPEFEAETDIGTVFTVRPTILDGNKTIRLELNPKITAYTGKDEYEVSWTTWGADGRDEKENRLVIWKPVIATRELSVTVDVNHGETLVIGGLSDSQTQKRVDKIPILADIPFIGRLFQSQSEISTRRNMLIFVTARLVGNDGSPLPMVENLGNGGIPMLMR